MRLAFLNLQSGVGLTRGGLGLVGAWRYLLPHATRALEPLGGWVRAQGIEVLGCVETELPSWRGRGVDYPQVLATTSGLDHHVSVPVFRVGRLLHQANSLHSRHPIVAWAAHPLPGGRQTRFALEATLEVEGVRWTVLVTHLSLSRSARAAQVAEVARLAGRTPERTVLMGDFNTGDEAEFAPLVSAGLVRAATGASHPSWGPAEALDHLFTSRALRCTGATVERGLLISDHLALRAEVA